MNGTDDFMTLGEEVSQYVYYLHFDITYFHKLIFHFHM